MVKSQSDKGHRVRFRCTRQNCNRENPRSHAPNRRLLRTRGLRRDAVHIDAHGLGLLEQRFDLFLDGHPLLRDVPVVPHALIPPGANDKDGVGVVGGDEALAADVAALVEAADAELLHQFEDFAFVAGADFSFDEDFRDHGDLLAVAAAGGVPGAGLGAGKQREHTPDWVVIDSRYLLRR